MNAEIVAIGTELLMGQIANGDAQILSRRLQTLGISVLWHQAVGDNPKRMREALSLALSRSDLVITTGGLGPTQDDLSKEIAAELLGLPMEFDAESWEAIRERMTRLRGNCPENNRRQAMFARGAEILPNACGTAPGCMIRTKGRILVQLPGPPGEMRDMLERQVLPRLTRMTGGCIASRYVRIYGVGESAVAERCADLIEAAGGVTTAPYCSTGECQLRVTSRGADEADALSRVLPVVEEIQRRLGSAVYEVAETADGSMQEAAVRALIAGGKTVALAESCTGGLAAARLVDVPGVSKTLLEACVAYADGAKVRLLGVSEDTLARFGAVSEETAREMAEGLRARSGADVAVAETGIAGPDGGTEEKPAGLVYVACATAEGTKVERLRLMGSRARVRELAALHMLDTVRRAALAGPAE